VKSGHDFAGRAYLQDQVMAGMDLATEKETIAKCVALLEQVSGTRPKGWISPSMAFSLHTRDCCLLPGRSGTARAIPICRAWSRRRVDRSSIFPGSDFTDNRMLKSSSLDLWDVYRETFDYLYNHEPGSYLPLSMHGQFGGRPMITAIFNKIFNICAAIRTFCSALTLRSPGHGQQARS
jgi:hypothetical protein